jgi:hypothetical protein
MLSRLSKERGSMYKNEESVVNSLEMNHTFLYASRGRCHAQLMLIPLYQQPMPTKGSPEHQNLQPPTPHMLPVWNMDLSIFGWHSIPFPNHVLEPPLLLAPICICTIPPPVIGDFSHLSLFSLLMNQLVNDVSWARMALKSTIQYL